jgi:hypothetical protein
VNDKPRTEREEVVRILAGEEQLIQAVIKKVLNIERSRLHLTRQSTATIDQLVNAIRDEVK